MSQNVKFQQITHQVRAIVGGDRTVGVTRVETGDMQIEWCSPDKDNGAAIVCTQVQLSEEGAMATALLLSKMFAEIEEAQAEEVAPGGEE